MNNTALNNQIVNLREQINKYYFYDESKIVEELLPLAKASETVVDNTKLLSLKISDIFRDNRKNATGIEALINQYSLSSEEGVALMCLAESLLHIPDKSNIDKLITDKLANVNWQNTSGSISSIFTNAASLGLSLTGKIVDDSSGGIISAAKNLAKKSSDPIIRKAIFSAMKYISEHYIMGYNIEEAINRAKDMEKLGFSYSFDMLGEEAITMHDAVKFFDSYKQAICSLENNSNDLTKNRSISIKLSALYPRFDWLKSNKVISYLKPKLIELIDLAKKYNVAITIDAEESYRLEITLDLVEEILKDNILDNWNGFGLVIQAYQKRALKVIDWLEEIATKYNRVINVRLVKGAYWDTEIKNSQIVGHEDYPVFTRKEATDLSYQACVNRLFNSNGSIYPQYATHNAYTIAYVQEIYKGSNKDFEFQCLHGMGDGLYKDLFASGLLQKTKCRIYAPVGSYDTLLPYLVRRLLENGANSSFLNQINLDREKLISMLDEPSILLKKYKSIPHSKIPKPGYLFGDFRMNSKGIDLTSSLEINNILLDVDSVKNNNKFKFIDNYSNNDSILSKIDFFKLNKKVNLQKVAAPFDNNFIVGEYKPATAEDVINSINLANKAFNSWYSTSVESRAALLEKTADLLWQHKSELIYLLIYEAGKIYADAINELREAIDFCNYYAAMAKTKLVDEKLVGPTGESNVISYHGRGVVACISPWNFPLAIFLGQISAALVAGNTVIAKPASNTTLIAHKVVELLHLAGIPKDVVIVLSASSKVIGKELTTNQHIKAVMLTGATSTAKTININLANRDGAIIPFIAETGGQNAMIVDSSALPEQVVKDVVNSAFLSAGQRCSALRVLYIQDDIADKIITMLQGAMQEIEIGDPSCLSTDVGPVIDSYAQSNLQKHVDFLDRNSKLIYKCKINPEFSANGSFIAPCAYEINSISELKQEHFGPILHIIRFKLKELDSVVEDINNTGFGLTFGVHSRIRSTIKNICNKINAGNLYINRNMVGAVVGVQPFGGEGLSGTGPKAGGPNYLQRLTTERVISDNIVAIGGNTELVNIDD